MDHPLQSIQELESPRLGEVGSEGFKLRQSLRSLGVGFGFDLGDELVELHGAEQCPA